MVKDKNVERHRDATMRLFNQPENFQIMLVLSGYTLLGTNNGQGTGFPDGKSDCSNFTGEGTCNGVKYQEPSTPGICGYSVGDWSGGSYTRVHRDIPVINAMRRFLGANTVSANDLGLPGYCTA